MHMTYPFMSLVMGVPGPKQVNILHLGARSRATKYSASGSLNESADTPYDPVCGPQVPQEAHGKHLFVPGAGSVGEITMTHGYNHRP